MSQTPHVPENGIKESSEQKSSFRGLLGRAEEFMRAEFVSIDHRRRRPTTETENDVAPLLRRTPVSSLHESSQRAEEKVLDIDAVLAGNDAFRIDFELSTQQPEPNFFTDPVTQPRNDLSSLPEELFSPQAKPLQKASPEKTLFMSRVDMPVLQQEKTENEVQKKDEETIPVDIWVRARDSYLEGKKDGKLVAYDVDADVALYEALAHQKEMPGYEWAKASLDAYTREQLTTHIGERLHVGISVFTYQLHDGQLLADKTREPALAMFDRGRDALRAKGKPVDFDRADAEVDCFEQIQEEMATAEIGTFALYASPEATTEELRQGSMYKHNFYDIAWKKDAETIVMYRYLSGLDAVETQARLGEIDERYRKEGTLSGAEFVRNLVVLKPGEFGFMTPEDIHKYLYKEHPHMTKETFDLLISACEPVFQEYINSLIEDPNNTVRHKRKFALVLNYADEVMYATNRIRPSTKNAVHPPPFIPPAINRGLETQAVRFVATPCGDSGERQVSSGSSFGFNAAFSVSELGGGSSSEKCETISCGREGCDWKASDSEASMVAKGELTACPDCGWKPGESKKAQEKTETKEDYELVR